MIGEVEVAQFIFALMLTLAFGLLGIPIGIWDSFWRWYYERKEKKRR